MSIERRIKDIMSGETQLQEADQSRRLDMLVRQGLMSPAKLPILKRGLAKLNDGKAMAPNERDAVKSLLNSFMFIVLGDDAVFNRAKQNTQKNKFQQEDVQEYVEETCSCCDNKIEAIKEGGCSDSLNAEKKPVKKATTKEDKVDAKGNKDSLEPEAKPIKKPKVSPTQVTIKDSNGKTLSMTFKEMLSKVSTEEELLESPQQEIPMMQKQLHFITYASEEIGDYLKAEGQDPEEWWQNKLAEVFSNVKSLYAYAKGDQMVNGKPLSASKMYKAGMSYESIEAGSFELQSETVIEVSEEDATVLNKMFSELTETNTKEMYSVLVADEAGYNEILEFAKENA